MDGVEFVRSKRLLNTDEHSIRHAVHVEQPSSVVTVADEVDATFMPVVGNDLGETAGFTLGDILAEGSPHAVSKCGIIRHFDHPWRDTG